MFWWALVRVRSRKMVFVMALIPVVLAPICRTISYIEEGRFPFNSTSFQNHADSLAIGCLLALCLGTSGQTMEKYILRHPGKLFMASVLCIGLPLVATRLFMLGPFTVPFGSTFGAIGIALLLALSLFFSSSRVCSWLDARAVATIGTWSYSIYLWQQIFCTAPSDLGLRAVPWWLTFPFWLLPVFFVAIASYYLIERPFLKMKTRFKS